MPLKDPSKRHKYKRKWYLDNRETVIARQKEYRRNNPERVRKLRKAWYDKNAKKIAISAIFANYGLTYNQYKMLLEQTGGKCPICQNNFTSKGKRKVVIDHCHKKNVFRGLICSACNIALGYFDDSLSTLRGAKIYLKKFYGAQNRISV